MHTSPRGPTLPLVLVMAVVAVLAWAARGVHDQRVAVQPYGFEWFSPDPDSMYQMRRVERALDEGLPPAETDARMNFPHGAAIPWPPYYTCVLYACVAPFAPSDSGERKSFVEMRVASMPRVFSTIASILIAAAAWRLLRGRPAGARALGSALAGSCYALMMASIHYSGAGNGDHHAWVSMLLAAMLLVAMRALERESLGDPRRSLALGAMLGVLAGVLLGSWVGGLVYVALVELALGLALLSHARAELRGLPRLGLAFHLAWAASIAPAVFASPWKESQPWMMVNLSWLHLAHPLLGACVFVPRLANGALRPRWPWIVAAAIAALAVSIAFADFALARGVRDGLAWASRSNEFMAFITESQPLGWGQIGGFGPTMQQLGYGALLLAPAWISVLWVAWRERRLDLAALALVLPPLALQALVQRRFGDALGVPMSIALGFSVASWTSQLWSDRAVLASCAGLVFGLALQFPTVRATPSRLQYPWDVEEIGYPQRATRELHRWIAEHSDPERMDSVLATWDQGHAIEWIAERASIATNFGSYLGRDSYLDPWRFFLEEDPRAAEELLERRQARYVLVTGDFSKDLEVMLRLLRPDTRRSYLLIPREGPVYASQRFFTTMAARLMMGGRVGDMEKRALAGDSLDFLRLVRVSPRALATPLPVIHTLQPVPQGWIWERVRGANVELRGAPGTPFSIVVELEGTPLQPQFSFVSSGTIGDDGIGRARVPYATREPNGDVRALGPARCQIGEQVREVAIGESDVLLGSTIAVP